MPCTYICQEWNSQVAMDAHDIFKKLTRGVYFSRKNVNNNALKVGIMSS